MAKRKKPTAKEVNQAVLENRQGLDIAFSSLNELRSYIAGLDKILDWYVEFKEDTDEFKKYIETNKAPKRDTDTDGADKSVSSGGEEIPKQGKGGDVSKKPV